jgi:carboxyl-terminal processing protease
VDENYVDAVEPDRLVGGAIRGMLRGLDPFSQYLDERSFSNLQSATQGSFGGIGIVVGVRENYPTVISPIEGTPAWSLGLQTGDVITQIEGASTAGYTVEEVADKLRGPKGTQVTITIRREGEERPRDFTITRDIIVTKSVPYAFMASDRVGYLRLANFSEHSGPEVRGALGTLASQGARALILDLRSNPGGLLNQAVDVAEQLVPAGQLIVYTRGRGHGQNNRYLAHGQDPRLDWPVVVLVDRGSASASEIVAGALQDLDRALVIGQRSYGKGSVQSIFPLRGGSSALKLTTALYYTPSGRSIHRLNGMTGEEFDDEGDEVGAPEARPDTAAGPVYHTVGGRTVKGGGGITPDVTLEPDSLPPVARQVEGRGLAFRFANRYVGRHPGLPRGFQADAAVWAEFLEFLKAEKLEPSAETSKLEQPRLRLALERELARRLAGDSAAVRVALRGDPVFQRGLGLLQKAAKPQDVFTLARATR